MKTLWVVIYRMGGTANFSWHRSVAFGSREQADACRSQIERGGRKALVERHDRSMNVGLPETFE